MSVKDWMRDLSKVFCVCVGSEPLDVDNRNSALVGIFRCIFVSSFIHMSALCVQYSNNNGLTVYRLTIPQSRSVSI